MTKITTLGSCRQLFMNNSKIHSNITYPHYTKEILQLIKYCKYGNDIVKPHETIYTFRTPILNNQILYYNKDIKNDFDSSDIFLIEIASKKKYIYNNLYLHHIAYDQHYKSCNSIKNNIILIEQDKDEIECDILEIKKELKKPFIIISHIVTINSGPRYDLSLWLEEICKKHNIPFINPVKEIYKKFTVDKIEDLFSPNEIVHNHLSNIGINYMRIIYNDKIKKELNI